MSHVLPFRALRPVRSLAASVAAPPYDVVSLHEARALIRENPLSFLRVEKSEADCPDGASLQEACLRARENLQAMIEGGIMVRDEGPSFYLYRLCSEGRCQTGIVAGVSLAEYKSGKIKRHELTRQDKEQERTVHMETVGGQTGPVFLAYRGNEILERCTQEIASREPEYDFVADDGVRHTVWVAAGQAITEEIRKGFCQVEALYIADGHHRAAAAASVAGQRSAGAGRDSTLLACLFPKEQLRIIGYHRLVRDLAGLTPEGFLRRLQERFVVSNGAGGGPPSAPHEIGMYMRGRWYCLAIRSEFLKAEDPVSGLDASLLQDHVLGPLLKIEDPRTDERISFVGGIKGPEELEGLVDGGGFAVAFNLYPPTIDQLMEVADSGRLMPPKSTWFEPKLLSGLFVHLWD